LLYISDKDGSYDLYQMNADGSGDKRLTTGKAIENARYSPDDGQSIAYVDWSGNTKTINIIPGNTIGSSVPPTHSFTLNDLYVYYVAFSPDGQRLIIDKVQSAGAPENLFTSTLDGADMQPLDSAISSGSLGYGYSWYTVPTSCQKASGDANCDGKVDDADYAIWQCEFVGNGSCASPASTLTADFNNDGWVSLVDFEVWRLHLNESPTATPVPTVPPSPASTNQETPTPGPTNTPGTKPTLTPTPTVVSDTTPTPSFTPVPRPTETPVPRPTNTPVPKPTNTPAPKPTSPP
ncbi:hypothetical protein HY214_03965, partial [Candidatus Roizmanbacteria bacterium]|nr:hypothetical protein [Candidatus Roizmanbacteria bacterium]